MCRSRYLGLAVGCVAFCALLLAACNSPLSYSTSSKKGSLQISLANNINARTLVPSIDMTVASYAVTGTGPNSATFTVTSTGAAVTQNGLAFGSWTIVVNATNSSGQLIGTGSASAQVNTGETTAVAVSVTPVAGTGTLSLGVSWPANQVQKPSISASLTPALGSAQTLSFVISGAGASYSNTSVGNGYYTLAFTLADNGTVVAGAVEVVRIVSGQTTSGSYTFSNVNAPGGTIQVNISTNLQDPLRVSIAGAQGTQSGGSTQTLTASVTNYTGSVVYVWYVNGVSAGTGSSFTFGTGVAAGYYRIDVTAYSGDGTQAGSATANVQVTAGSSLGPYLYVTDENSAAVSCYSISASGALVPLSTPSVATGASPYGIAATPNRAYLYMSNAVSNSLSAFAIGAGGLLTPLSTPTFATGSDPTAIAITPDGSFLYVTNANSNTVSAFAIGPAGLLTPLGTPTPTGGSSPFGIAMTPNGSYLYVANSGSNSISAFAIGGNGSLSPLSTPTFAGGNYPFRMAITPNGAYLYVANSGGNNVSAYSIGPDGSLAPLSTPTFPSGQAPLQPVITPNGSYLYVTNDNNSSASAYAIGAGGLLQPLSPPTFAAGFDPIGIAITPDGSFLYIGNFSSSISAYSVGPDGSVKPLSTPTFATLSLPQGIVIVP